MPASPRYMARRIWKRFPFLCSDTGKVERVPASAMFIFIGALPQNRMAGRVVERDDRGFILTGPDLIAGDRGPKGGRSIAIRFLLETNVPGHLRRGRRAAQLGETSGFRSGRRIGGRAVHSSVLEQGINDRSIGTPSRSRIR